MKIKEIFSKYYIIVLISLLTMILVFSIIEMAKSFNLTSVSYTLSCLLAIVFAILFERQRWETTMAVLRAQTDMAKSYKDLLNKSSALIDQFLGYDEKLSEELAIYSQMAARGVEAPIANTIINFANDTSDDYTAILIGIDHAGAKWNVRFAGRTIYLSQLESVLNLAKEHFEKNAGKAGSLVIKNKSVLN